MSHERGVAELLGIEPGSLVWIVGDSVEETALLDPLPEGVETYQDDDLDQIDSGFDDTWTGTGRDSDSPEPTKPSGVDTALIAVSNTQEFHMRLDDVLPRMGSVTRVWVIFPADAVPLTIVRNGVDEYGWVADDTIDLDETWAAVQLQQS